jgi:hypothetical protein
MFLLRNEAVEIVVFEGSVSKLSKHANSKASLYTKNAE